MPSQKQSSGVTLILPLGGELDRESARFEARARAVSSLREGAGDDLEVLIAADASTPRGTCERLEARGLRVLRAETRTPRGSRMRAAAARARFDILLFSHWDTEIAASALRELRDTARRERPWGALRLRFQDASGRTCMPWIARAANLRARVLGLPYGDQGQWVLREAYESVEGHPAWNFLEDLELARRLRSLARPTLLRAHATTSARRYEERGRFRTVWTNSRILLRFARGEDPSELEKIYRDQGPTVERRGSSIYGRTR